MLVFDLTSLSSFEHVSKWLHDIKTYSHEKIRVTLVGNKSDLESSRTVSKEAINEFIKTNNIEKYY